MCGQPWQKGQFPRRHCFPQNQGRQPTRGANTQQKMFPTQPKTLWGYRAVYGYFYCDGNWFCGVGLVAWVYTRSMLVEVADQGFKISQEKRGSCMQERVNIPGIKKNKREKGKRKIVQHSVLYKRHQLFILSILSCIISPLQPPEHKKVLFFFVGRYCTSEHDPATGWLVSWPCPG